MIASLLPWRVYILTTLCARLRIKLNARSRKIHFEKSHSQVGSDFGSFEVAGFSLHESMQRNWLLGNEPFCRQLELMLRPPAATINIADCEVNLSSLTRFDFERHSIFINSSSPPTPPIVLSQPAAVDSIEHSCESCCSAVDAKGR
jgi:hypothetical protein